MRAAKAKLTVTIVLSLLSGVPTCGQNSSVAGKKETILVQQAKGAFEVKIAPVESSPIAQQANIGRMTIDKTFSGALEGSSKGEMLTGTTESTGAMAYVAIERVTGKLEGRSGSFVLMHNASMLKSDPKSGEMHVMVVPASGTGELAGLTGSMTIAINSAGKHTYDFAYTLP